MTCRICDLFPTLDPHTTQGAVGLVQSCQCGGILGFHERDHPHRLLAHLPRAAGRTCAGFQPEAFASDLSPMTEDTP